MTKRLTRHARLHPTLPVTNVKILVIRSFQLAAGVGGLRPRNLLSALDQARTSTTPILLATAAGATL